MLACFQVQPDIGIADFTRERDKQQDTGQRQ
jgi:hypothetical protein